MYKILQQKLIQFFWLCILFLTVHFTSTDLEIAIKDKLLLVTIALAVIIIISNFHLLNVTIRFFLLAIFIFFLYLVIKANIIYHHPFIYPNVFSRIVILFLLPSGYISYKLSEKKNLSVLLKLFYVLLVIKLLISGKYTSFQWGEDYRLIYCEEASVFMIPYFITLIGYLQGKKSILWPLFFLIIIFIAQHRTVWVCSIAGTLLILFSYPKKVLSIISVLPLIVLAISISGFVVYNAINEDVKKQIASQFSDIVNAEDQGTGSWRYEQSLYYLQQIKERPISGWDFTAYEKGEVMAPTEWGSEMGTHIHTGYIDSLYYFGIIGIILNYGIFFIASTYFKKLRRFEVCFQAILIFIMVVFVYSISYQLQYYFYPLCGFGLAYFNNYRTVKHREFSINTIPAIS